MDRNAFPPRDVVAAVEAAATAEEKLAVLRSQCQVEAVRPDQGFEQDSVYLLVGPKACYLVRTLSPAVVDGHVHLRSLVDAAVLKPVALERLAAAIARQGVYAVRPAPADFTERDRIMDIGAFTQLVDAAQRSGLVPTSAAIIQVRDCEFRLGRHAKALSLMESMFQGFLARATQRAQQLAREETDIASGRLRLSPRELQAKRARDNQQTQCIERARTRFARVVEGLRAIVQRGL